MGKDTTLASKVTSGYSGANWYLVTPGYGSSMRVMDGLLLEADDYGELAVSLHHSERGVLRFHVESGAVWLYVCHADWFLSSEAGPIRGPFEIRSPTLLRFADWTAHLTTDLTDSDGEHSVELTVEKKPPEQVVPLRFMLVEETPPQTETAAPAEVESEPDSIIAMKTHDARQRQGASIDRVKSAMEPEQGRLVERASLRSRAAPAIQRRAVEDDVPVLMDEYLQSDTYLGETDPLLQGEIELPEPERNVGIAPKQYLSETQVWTANRPTYIAGKSSRSRRSPRRNRAVPLNQAPPEAVPVELGRNHGWLALILLVFGLLLSEQAQLPVVAMDPGITAEWEEEEESAQRLVEAVDELIKDKEQLDAATLKFAVEAYQTVGRPDSNLQRLQRPMVEEETGPAVSALNDVNTPQ